MDFLWAGGRGRAGSTADTAASGTPVLRSWIPLGFAAVLRRSDGSGAQHSHCEAGKRGRWTRPTCLRHPDLYFVFQGFIGKAEKTARRLAAEQLAAPE